ncbi:MAG: homocysteine S-methyltransferase family protein [Nitrospirae bacterium]|nr:homocysteine S-methyltransferase family protein [Nitrospirota bacterium]
MSNRADRTKLLHELLDERIVVMDGAMGTAIHQHDLPIDEFGGPAFENCSEVLNPRRPDVILDIHSSYLEAGSDIIEDFHQGETLRFEGAEFSEENLSVTQNGDDVKIMFGDQDVEVTVNGIDLEKHSYTVTQEEGAVVITFVDDD